MATLQIRKETSKVWRHVPSDELPYIVSKLYIKSEGDNIRVVELGGSQRGIYNFADVSVYDIGGVAETFTSASELMQRLEALGYIGFFYEGEVSPSTLISADLGNIIELGSDGKLYAIGGGGGGSQDLQSVTDLGNTTTNEITASGFISAGSGSFGGIILNDGDLNDIAYLSSLATTINPRDYIFPDENGTIATREWADENKVNKVTTAGLERVYTINADGSQGTKATSELGGKRTQTVEFAINQNIAASTFWYGFYTFNSNINTAQLTSAGTSAVTPTNNFANVPVQSPCKQVNFNCKIKNARFRGGTNSPSTDVRICIVKSLGASSTLIANSDIIADKTFNTNLTASSIITQNFIGADLDTSVTIDAGSEIRFFFFNNNISSNLFSGILTVEFEEI